MAAITKEINRATKRNAKSKKQLTKTQKNLENEQVRYETIITHLHKHHKGDIKRLEENLCQDKEDSEKECIRHKDTVHEEKTAKVQCGSEIK